MVFEKTQNHHIPIQWLGRRVPEPWASIFPTKESGAVKGATNRVSQPRDSYIMLYLYTVYIYICNIHLYLYILLVLSHHIIWYSHDFPEMPPMILQCYIYIFDKVQYPNISLVLFGVIPQYIPVISYGKSQPLLIVIYIPLCWFGLVLSHYPILSHGFIPWFVGKKCLET